MSSSTSVTNAWDTIAVSDFDTGDRDVLVVPRPGIAGLDDADLRAAVQAGRIHEYLAPVRPDRIGFEVRGGLAELRLKFRPFADDVIGLVTSFFDQFGPPQIRLRMEITRTQSCPKFHTDNLQMRLVTTYLGPTTEYQFAGASEVHSAPLGGLVFLKGHRHATHRDGVHHRSPAVPAGEKRLCIAIDF
ncbi:MAG: DUF1826 domain-containing protein [Planctomycetota bacterium]